MVFGLALVLAMLGMLSVSGISGWRSYREIVRDLDISLNRAPRKTELARAISRLNEPLLWRAPETAAVESRLHEEFRADQFQEFQRRLRSVRERLKEFRYRLEALPPSPRTLARRPVAEAVLAPIEQRLAKLETLQEGQALLDASRRPAAVETMLRDVAHLQVAVGDLPNYQAGLRRTLAHAEGVSRSRFWLIGGTTVCVLLLFCGLVRSSYVWIFAPLTRLHQGASRVAQGDFDYRVQLGTHDEIGELAEAFNQMTARFQEVAEDLDRKVQERSRQLVRSERLAGIGFLAAGVAHEINNPLQAIMTAAESLDGRCSELEDDAGEQTAVLQQYFRMIQREAVRCREITGRLLDFARGEGSERSRYDLRALISEVLGLVGHVDRFRDRHIVFDAEPPCYVEVNATEIKQVVLNLVANALEAMKSGGTLTIRLVEQTDQVVVSFVDDGCGMSPEVLENLFDPFFTRKQDGRGTGLGMSISHRIISDHDGVIEAASDGPGRGSTFRIQLPRRAAGSGAAA